VSKPSRPPDLSVGCVNKRTPRKCSIYSAAIEVEQPDGTGGLGGDVCIESRAKISKLLKKRGEDERLQHSRMLRNAAKVQQSIALPPDLSNPVSTFTKANGACDLGEVSEIWIDSVLSEQLSGNIGGYLVKNGLDRPSLGEAGLEKVEMDRIYRSLYVYSVGFNQSISEVVSKKNTSPDALAPVIGRVWQTYSRLLQKVDGARGCVDGVAALEKLHGNVVKNLKDRHFEHMQQMAKEKMELIKHCAKQETELDVAQNETELHMKKVTELHAGNFDKQARIDELLLQLDQRKTEIQRASDYRTLLENKMKEDALVYNNKTSEIQSLKDQIYEKDLRLGEQAEQFQNSQSHNAMVLKQLQQSRAEVLQEKEERKVAEGKCLKSEKESKRMEERLQHAEAERGLMSRKVQVLLQELRQVKVDRNIAQRKAAGYEDKLNTLQNSGDDNEDKLKVLSSELRRVNAEHAKLKQELMNVSSKTDRYRTKAEKLQVACNALKKSRDDTQADLLIAGQSITRKNEEIKVLLVEYDKVLRDKETMEDSLMSEKKSLGQTSNKAQQLENMLAIAERKLESTLVKNELLQKAAHDMEKAVFKKDTEYQKRETAIRTELQRVEASRAEIRAQMDAQEATAKHMEAEIMNLKRTNEQLELRLTGTQQQLFRMQANIQDQTKDHSRILELKTVYEVALDTILTASMKTLREALMLNEDGLPVESNEAQRLDAASIVEKTVIQAKESFKQIRKKLYAAEQQIKQRDRALDQSSDELQKQIVQSNVNLQELQVEFEAAQEASRRAEQIAHEYAEKLSSSQRNVEMALHDHEGQLLIRQHQKRQIEKAVIVVQEMKDDNQDLIESLESEMEQNATLEKLLLNAQQDLEEKTQQLIERTPVQILKNDVGTQCAMEPPRQPAVPLQTQFNNLTEARAGTLTETEA